MGKIRSTLDIVMDRTKNLSMTSEERENLKRKELSDTVRAWVQRYLDGKMNLDEMRARVESSGDDRPLELSLLKSELVSGILLGVDNDKLIDALDRVCGIDKGKISAIIDDHQTKLDALISRNLEHLRLQLEKEGIRWSSVVPNLARSESWQDSARKVQDSLTREITGIL